MHPVKQGPPRTSPYKIASLVSGPRRGCQAYDTAHSYGSRHGWKVLPELPNARIETFSTVGVAARYGAIDDREGGGAAGVLLALRPLAVLLRRGAGATV